MGAAMGIGDVSCYNENSQIHTANVDRLAAEGIKFNDAHATAVRVPLLPSAEFEGKSGIGPYGDFVLQTDTMVGELMAKLEEKGIADNTMFIFASDNGCGANVDYPALIAKGHNPSYIYRGCKGDIWEGGHRIPYIVKFPGVIPAGIESDQTVSLSDVMATWSEYFQIPLPENAGEDSISHLCLWRGEDRQVREDTKPASKPYIGNPASPQGNMERRAESS